MVHAPLPYELVANWNVQLETPLGDLPAVGDGADSSRTICHSTAHRPRP
jgi:hypothetical protein